MSKKVMESKKFLENYINAYSPVAQEWEGQKIWTDYVKNYVDEVHSDNYGTVYGVIKSEELNKRDNDFRSQVAINGAKPLDRYKVVIEAHCDEISWIITHIDSDGLVYVTKHGGSDAAIAPSKKVLIHTRKHGKIPGVFGFPAIHVRKTADEKCPKPENLFIDLGYHNKTSVAELGVEVGNIVTFEETFSILGNYYCGKSLDNKIGGYIISQVAKKIKDDNIKLPFDLYVVNSVQEEVGLMGARNIAQHLKADVALVHDVCHATSTTPGMSKIKNCDITSGDGPTLEYASQNHRLLLDYIREIGDNNKIPYQVEVGSQGNDTMGFFFANTVTAIIASPLKYMHTTVEMVHKKDVKNAIELMYQCLVNMTCRSWKYYEY
jgi:putative aminopeptidase FrvX